MSQLITIQAARGIAANLVVLSHLCIVEAKYTAGGVLPAFTFYGIAGVDLFFVLSGFIMVAVAGHYTGAIDFLWRRVTRIYPTYWLASLVVLGLAIFVPTIVNSSVNVPISLWCSFLLIPDRTVPLLAVGWTLVHEMYFYLAFATFLALRIPIFAGLITWGLVLLLIMATIPDKVASLPVLRLVTSPLTAEFMMGAIVGILWRKHFASAAIAIGVAGLFSLVLAIVYVAPMLSLATSQHLEAWRVVIFGFPSALIVYALAAVEHLHPSMRTGKLLVSLGDWSYATYLTHVLAISAIGRMLALFVPNGGVGASLALIAVGLLIANISGAGVHIFFERPTLSWLHEFGVRFRRAVGVACDRVIEQGSQAAECSSRRTVVPDTLGCTRSVAHGTSFVDDGK
jgi:peptidoglycan/LPS O-acetylase OafA/YrhL